MFTSSKHLAARWQGVNYSQLLAPNLGVTQRRNAAAAYCGGNQSSGLWYTTVNRAAVVTRTAVLSWTARRAGGNAAGSEAVAHLTECRFLAYGLIASRSPRPGDSLQPRQGFAVGRPLRGAGLILSVLGKTLGLPFSGLSGTSWPSILSLLPQPLTPLEVFRHFCRTKFGTHQVLGDGLAAGFIAAHS